MTDERRFAEAMTWHSGQNQAEFDWDGFTHWLEADRANRAAYDEAALLDDTFDRNRHLLVDAGEPANDNRRIWFGWVSGIAATVAAAALFLPMVPSDQRKPAASPPSLYVTRAGETRTVSLPRGITVTLAPESILEVAGEQLTIKGEGYFAVAHDPARKLLVTAGPIQVSDIGTTFSAATFGRTARIAVAEGSLVVSASGIHHNLGAGQAAQFERDRLIVSAVAPDSIGDWRDGSLTFDNAPLSLVAAQLTRYSRERVSVDPSIADQRFSGVVAIGDKEKPGEAVAAIMRVDARRDSTDLRLGPAR